MKLMRIKYLIGSLLLAGTYGMVLTSCSDDLTIKDPSINLGSKVRGVMTVPLNVPIAGSGTRTVDFDPNAILKIDSYWIGIYDTYTGELLGSKLDEKPRKDDDSRFTFNGISSNFEVNDVDIYYYENHPEAFVVGVVNFNNVKAKNAGTDEELTDLVDLLKNAKDWDAFCSISIDAKSAETANPNESDGFGKIPLMMGYYTTGFNGSHPTVKGWDNNQVDQSNVKTVFSEGSSGNVALPTGAIKLMRLVSQVTVHVGGPSIIDDFIEGRSTRAPSIVPLPTPVYPSDDYIKIKNLQYKVVNNPKSFYLAERATDTEGSKISSSKADYDKRSANSADYDGEDGYSETGWISVNGNTFTYQQFENKHWGNGSWFDMRDLVLPSEDIDDEDIDYINQLIWTQQNGVFFIREKKFTDTNVFKSLCPGENVNYNNNAPYIIIKADVEFDYPDNYSNREESGSVEFMIHEGFIADSKGNVIPMPRFNGGNDEQYEQYMYELINFTQHAVNDYQRYRNTKYDYYIGIAGLEQIMMKVYLSQFGEQMGFNPDAVYDDGINGKLNDVSKYNLDGNGTIEKYNDTSNLAAYPLYPYRYGSSSDEDFFEVFWYAYYNRKDLKWVYSTNDPTTSRKYGDWLAQDNNIGGLPEFGYVDKNIPEELLNSVKIIITDNEDPGEFAYPEGTEYIIPGKKVHEWNLKEFIETDIELNYEDFIYNNGVDPKYVVYVYISQLEAGPDVDFKMLDMVYRDFYFKIPIAKDKYATTTYDAYFSIHQTPLDNRTEIYQRPSLNIRDYHHSYHSYSGYWTTAHNLVNYLCWNWSYGDVKAEYFILKVGDDDEIIVRTDEYGNPYTGEIHYPYHVSADLDAGYNRISIRPMGLMNPDGTPSNYKMTYPAVFDEVFFVQRDPYWVFNSSSVFASALPSDGNTYRGTVERYGMTIYGSTSSSGLIPYLGSGYIQTGGSGGINQRSFNIIVDRPGKLVVNACKTGSGERGFNMRERNMTANEYNPSPVYVSVDRTIGDPTDYEIQTSYITGPTELILYPSANLNIYSIRFVPN